MKLLALLLIFISSQIVSAEDDGGGTYVGVVKTTVKINDGFDKVSGSKSFKTKLAKKNEALPGTFIIDKTEFELPFLQVYYGDYLYITTWQIRAKFSSEQISKILSETCPETCLAKNLRIKNLLTSMKSQNNLYTISSYYRKNYYSGYSSDEIDRKPTLSLYDGKILVVTLEFSFSKGCFKPGILNKHGLTGGDVADHMNGN